VVRSSFVRFAYPAAQSVASVALFSHFMSAVVSRTISGEWPLVGAIAALRSDQAERPERVGSVSSAMHQAAVRLLDAATVSNPPHY
jgi:hypothetical protein